MTEAPTAFPTLAERAEQLFTQYTDENNKKVSRWFAALMVAQWLVAIFVALTWSPSAWEGRMRSTHVHVWVALLLGGAVSSLPLVLALRRPTAVSTRHVVAIAQMLWSALFIHLGGGRIETHFHVFVSFAFLAFYRDWKPLVPAAVVVATDHLLRGLFWPESVYGISNPEWWRFLEHAFWVVFEVVVLIPACMRGVAETMAVATNQARAEEKSIELEKTYAELDRNRRDENVRLEGQVRDRTRELRLVLDHVAEGLTTIDADGLLAKERSRALTRWFGDAEASDTLWSFLGRIDARFGERLRVGWEMVRADVLPLELGLEQLPRTLHCRGRTFELSITPLEDAAEAGFLVVFSDVTTELEQGEAEAARRDLGAALDQIIRDRQAFAEFVAEGTALVTRVSEAASQSPELMRDLHTLKGNTALMGFDSVATLCHSMETYVLETGEPPAQADREQLRERWTRIAATVGTLTGGSESRVEVERRDLSRLVTAIETNEPKDALLSRARSLELEPAQRRLERLADQARTFAARMGKTGLAVDVTANDVRLEPAKWQRFWSAMVQVVRNAVTHGIEPSPARVDANKPEGGRIALATRLDPTQLVIEVRDDGRGIDWDAVGEAATKSGLPRATRSDLERALFSLGVTTRDEVDEAAGRGVGLSAALDETEKLGGKIELETTPGTGTLFRFRFPKKSLGASAVALAR